MKRTDVTYNQLDKVLRALGFTWRPGNSDPPGRIYEHRITGAIVALPAYRESEKVYEHHLAAAQSELEAFGIADATAFEDQLQTAG